MKTLSKNLRPKMGLMVAIILLSSLSAAAEGQLRAIFSYSLFLSPPSSPYVETYLAIDAASLMLPVQSNGKLQGEVEITIMFEQNEKVVDYEKLLLKSPELDESPGESRYFMLQNRFALDNGRYDVVLVMRDINKEAEPFMHREEVLIDFPEQGVLMSDILFVESFSRVETPTNKSRFGYELTPRLLPFFPKEVNHLTFYLEAYRLEEIMGKDSRFVFQFFVEDFETGGQKMDFAGASREKSMPVNMLMKRFDISELPSGNYYLVAQIRNSENKVVTEERLFFQRSNPGVEPKMAQIEFLNVANTFAAKMNNIDSLADYINALHPISSEMEKLYSQNQLSTRDLTQMQQYFFHFWQVRNPNNPEAAWMEYKERVDYVNATYGFKGKGGYKNDRGRVMLQYGKPDAIAARSFETCYLPFEIWQYYQLTPTQRDKRFVFVQYNIGGLTYDLIHSDAHGEIFDGLWYRHISKPLTKSPGGFESLESFKQSSSNDVDCNSINLQDLYRNPR